ncbi:MAG: AAA family ATPase [Roseivirga sp.]
MKIHILGASGSGTTTLGQALGKQGWHHLDADDYYWVKTDPPFQEKVPVDLRNKNITQDFLAADNVVISGSMFSWGEQWKRAFDLVIFLQLDPELRMKRLRAREVERYGQALLDDPAIKSGSEAFLNWAEQYDKGTFTGRSLALHEQWLSDLACPVLRLDGAATLEENVRLVLQQAQL